MQLMARHNRRPGCTLGSTRQKEFRGDPAGLQDIPALIPYQCRFAIPVRGLGRRITRRHSRRLCPRRCSWSGRRLRRRLRHHLRFSATFSPETKKTSTEVWEEEGTRPTHGTKRDAESWQLGHGFGHHRRLRLHLRISATFSPETQTSTEVWEEEGTRPTHGTKRGCRELATGAWFWSRPPLSWDIYCRDLRGREDSSVLTAITTSGCFFGMPLGCYGLFFFIAARGKVQSTVTQKRL